MSGAASFPAGYTILKTEDPGRSRPILVDVWYPAADSALEESHAYTRGRQGSVAVDARPAAEHVPVIVLSHGAFGLARHYSWIAEALARRGFIVAGVSHFGESPLYGEETVDPAEVLRPWHRPRDCSRALDFLFAHPLFKGVADPQRVGGIGHSSGGATMIWLAGAVFDPSAMRDYCHSEAARGDRGCMYGTGDGNGSIPEEARESYWDSRMRAVVALDPALGPGFNARSLSRVQIPVHIVGSVVNDFLPFAHHAGRFARLIPGASLTPLAHGEGHFVFVDECVEEREVQGVRLCRDRDGVERTAVHEKLAGVVGRFLVEHLGSAALPVEI